MRRFAFTCVSLVAVLLTAGCGGGASGSAEDRTNARPTSDVLQTRSSNRAPLIKGTATKGVLQHAAVSVYVLDEFGRRVGEPLAQTETDASGAYSIALDGAFPDSLLEIEVSAIDGRTSMICDARRCGSARRYEQVELPADFSFSTIVESSPQLSSLNGSVSPWSAMAAERARHLYDTGASLSLLTALRQANAEVAQIVGFDLSATGSKGLSQLHLAAGAQQQYAVMNAVAAEIIYWLARSSTVTDAFQQFSQALNQDGVIGRGEEGFKLEDLADTVRHLVNITPALDAEVVEALANLVAQFDLSGSRGFAPGYAKDFVLEEDATEEDKIFAFQEFVGQVRTWISSVEELDGNELLSAVSIDSNTVETLIDGDVKGQFELAVELVDQVVAFIAENRDKVEERLLKGGEETIVIRNRTGAPIGSARLSFWDSDGITVAMRGELTGAGNDSYAPFDLTLNTGLSVHEITSSEGELDDDSALQRMLSQLDSNHMRLSGSLEKGEAAPALVIEDVSLTFEVDPGVQSRMIGGERVLGVFRSVSLMGDVSIRNAGARFSGGVEIGLGRLGAGARAIGRTSGPLWFEKFSLSGEFASADRAHIFSASVAANIKSASAFDTFTWAQYQDDHRYVYGALDDVDSLLSLSETDWGDVVMPGFVLEANFAPNKAHEGRVYFSGYRGDAATRAAYQQCENFVNGELERDILELAHLEQQCAVSELEPVVENAQVTDGQLKRLKKTIEGKLREEFGDNPALMRNMALTNVYGYADAGEGRGHYIASVHVPEGTVANGFRDESFTVASRVDIPELRSAQVAATVNRTSYRGGDMRANVKWEGGSYTALFAVDDIDEPTHVSIQLLNMQGYQLTMDVTLDEEGDIQLTGDARINGEKIGDVELRGGALPMIVYPKGDHVLIESLY